MTAIGPAHGIDETVYPMPSFVTFSCPDIEATSTWWQVAGFIVLARMPGGLVHLRRLRHQDVLLAPGPPSPGGGRYSVAAGADDLQRRADALREAYPHLATHGPADTPWFTRDVVATDPDGHVLVLTSPRVNEAMADQQWVDTVRDSLRSGSDEH